LASLASGNEIFEIRFFFTRMEENAETGRFRRADIHSDVISMSWDDMFCLVGPSLIQANEGWSIPRVLIPVIERRVKHKLHKQWPTNRFQKFLIDSGDADTILLQLRALKLITLSKDGTWGLTPYGDNYMARLLAVPKGERRRE
jgi:hypothetical protein